MRGEPVAETTYLGATEAELSDVNLGERLVGIVAQSSFFKHRGDLRIETDAVVLDGWLRVPRTCVSSIELVFTGHYTRFMAGGARGGFPSLGFFGHLGKPLVLRRDDGGPLYLLLGYSRLLGTTRNAEWLPRLRAWHETGAP